MVWGNEDSKPNRKQANETRKDVQMRTFRTFEELIEFVSDQENIETLNNGEVTIKDWNEDAKALKKYWKEYPPFDEGCHA